MVRRVCLAFGLGAVCLLLAFPLGTLAKDCQQAPEFAIGRHAAMLDANQIAMWITNYGSVARNPETGNAGFYYPKGSEKTAIYAAGLWVAGKVNGEIRTACADYTTEFQPGVILPDGRPDDPGLQKYRVYKIKPGDSADPGSPNYNPDYAEWPVEDGAPVDKNGLPLIIGDQTVWCVMNDANPAVHSQAYYSAPLGLEVQLLAWASQDSITPLGKAVFLHYTLINKGRDPIEDAYVGLWVDPDLGHASDDGSGCDTTLNLTYVYNRNTTDPVYGLHVPAVGVCLLQGPAVPAPGDTAWQFMHAPIAGARTLSTTSNSVYY